MCALVDQQDFVSQGGGGWHDNCISVLCCGGLAEMGWSGLERGVRCVVVGHAAAPRLRCHFHRHICVCTANNISDAGATALAEALKTNNTVQSVDLHGMSCVCSWCCVVLEAAPLRAHLFGQWTAVAVTAPGALREGRAVVWDACLRGPVGVGAGAVLGGSSWGVSATCVDQEPFFRGRLVAGRGCLCVGCHAGPGGRARGLGTSSPCLTTTTFSLISTTSRHAGFMYLLLPSCIRSDLCISVPSFATSAGQQPQHVGYHC